MSRNSGVQVTSIEEKIAGRDLKEDTRACGSKIVGDGLGEHPPWSSGLPFPVPHSRQPSKEEEDERRDVFKQFKEASVSSDMSLVRSIC